MLIDNTSFLNDTVLDNKKSKLTSKDKTNFRYNILKQHITSISDTSTIELSNIGIKAMNDDNFSIINNYIKEI